MTDIDVDQLDAILRSLREAGVTRFKCGEFAVEFPETHTLSPAAPAKQESTAYQRLLGNQLPTLRAASH